MLVSIRAGVELEQELAENAVEGYALGGIEDGASNQIREVRPVMSMINPDTPAAIVRGVAAETLGNPDQPPAIRLLADSSATGGALSAQRVFLGRGAEGATPHRHTGSSELFYVLDGSAQILAGTEVVTMQQGDLAVVPPQLPHAFAATADAGADLLIVITPGVERFGYFRLLASVMQGQAAFEELLAAQETYDNYFLDSPEWRAART